MAGPDPHLLDLLCRRITAAAAQHTGLLVVGICGAQGSGKSTLVAALAARLNQQGTACAALSLDDLYLRRAERAQLARDVHPLLATRGVPGTHDVALGMATIAALDRGEPAKLPRFDKGRDDRADEADWTCAPRGTQVLLLEGWCVGARPQGQVALIEPINALEAAEDREAIWRGYANAALAGAYQDLFGRIDLLILLAAPGWDVVAKWREEQEQVLRTAAAPRAMDPPEIARFIQHYERLTRWILTELPGRADLLVRLGAKREVQR
ncbi:kinase [Novosphingobium sp.]|uniref:kinase n=1 Tax=Novosphingobium sp. TaxID=1874826 RepID=UPI002869F338|nr:kinase [Novosphingobium sp.]